VRQLRREVERLVALPPEGESVELSNCSAEVRADAAGGESPRHPDGSTLPARVETLEIELIRESLRQTGGNRARAAALLGITRQGLHKKMKRYAVDGG
jgi:transcriptional regulator with PAS, ATPase and Fis domain